MSFETAVRALMLLLMGGMTVDILLKAVYEFDPAEKLFSPPLKTLLTLGASMGFSFLASAQFLTPFASAAIPPVVDHLVTGLLIFQTSKILGEVLSKLTG